MSKPAIHAVSSVKKYGGKESCYIKIHQMMDSSKAAHSTNMHRVVFHHIFGTFIIEQMFGIDYDALEELREKYNLPEEFIKDAIKWKDQCTETGKVRINTDGKKFSPRDIAEQHCLEDFRHKFIPTLTDYIEDAQIFPPFVNNGMDVPNRLKRNKKSEQIPVEETPLDLTFIPAEIQVMDGQASKRTMRRKTISPGNLD